jgi:hypothetical protein
MEKAMKLVPERGEISGTRLKVLGIMTRALTANYGAATVREW